MGRYSLAACVIGLVCLSLLGWVSRERVLTGRNDFAQLYAGATLAGGPGLYSREANLRVIGEHLGVTLQSVLYSRLPFYALLLKPLSWMPYRTAHFVFLGINLAALIAFAALAAKWAPEIPVFVAVSLPALMSLFAGQDTALLLAIAAGGYALIRSGREFAGGAVLSLCSIKFHIFLVPWIVVAVFRRRAAMGIASGGAVLVVLSYLAGGWTWPVDYRARASSAELHPASDIMPTFRSLAEALGTPDLATAAAGSVVALALLVAFVRRSRDFDVSFAMALVAGLLLSWHAYLQDAVVLLLALAIAVDRSRDKAVRSALAILALPPVWFLLLSGKPWSALVPVALLATLALACAAGHPQVEGVEQGLARGIGPGGVRPRLDPGLG